MWQCPDEACQDVLNMMKTHLLIELLLCSPVLGWSQKALMGHVQPVRFKRPVEVIVRLNSPVPNAEHRLIMEKQLVAHLDTFSLQDLLRHPGIYFAAIYTASYGEYKAVAPVTRGNGLYPFNTRPIVVEELERPLKGRYYTRWQPADNYRRWLVRKDASDFGPSNPPNTLPGVDSVRVVYVLKRSKR